MKSDFKDFKVSCPECGYENKVDASDDHEADYLHCSGCGVYFGFTTEYKLVVDEVFALGYDL